MIQALLLLLLAATPAAAQRSGCGMGLGLEALRAADRLLQASPASLPAGRDAGGAAAGQLAEAASRLAGCGCRQVAGLVQDAASIAEEAGAEASLERLRRILERARFSAGLARQRLDRQGCS